MKAYEETIRETATEDAPWYVVPADNKWFTRVVVAAAVIDALASLNLHYPKVSAAKKKSWRRREPRCSLPNEPAACDNATNANTKAVPTPRSVYGPALLIEPD